MTTKGAVATVDAVTEAEALRRLEAQAAAEAVFRRRPAFVASFRREGEEVRFRAEWTALPGGNGTVGDTVERLATDADREAYPAEYAAFVDADGARK